MEKSMSEAFHYYYEGYPDSEKKYYKYKVDLLLLPLQKVLPSFLLEGIGKLLYRNQKWKSGVRDFYLYREIPTRYWNQFKKTGYMKKGGKIYNYGEKYKWREIRQIEAKYIDEKKNK